MKRFFLAAGIAVFLAAAGAAAYTAWSLLGSPASFQEAAVVTIEPGHSTRAITRTLAAHGMIRNRYTTELYARVSGTARGLQAGRYLLEPGMTPPEMLRKIASGDAEFDHIRVTIPEGWMVEQIDSYLAQVGVFEKRSFVAAVIDHQPDLDRHPLLESLPENIPIEGYLYPDTYFILADTEPADLINRMLDELHQQLPQDMATQAAARDATVHEILTLASIVQKESPAGDERPIAGVFWNRLERRIRLESDATVNYVLGTKNLQPTFADTAVDHPYNTYRNYGLPPGPIGNPGLDAISAALHPAEHDYLFFLHKPTMETVFSRTFAEHLAAKARYLD